MTVLGCGYYDHFGATTTPTIPYLPGPEPDRASVQPGGQAEELMVAVGRFPAGTSYRVLTEARIDALSIRARHLGPNSVTISAPTTPHTMRSLGDLISTEVDQFGRPLYHVKKAIEFELLVGSNVDGLVRWRFVCRDGVEVSGGRVSITATGFIGGLTADRVIGAPTRLNLLRAHGSFDHGDFQGWSLVSVDASGTHRATGGAGITSLYAGTATAGLVTGGPDGGAWHAWVQGTPGQAWLEARARYAQPARPWGRQRIATLAYVKLPTGEDIEDYGLVTTAVLQGGVEVWPSPKYGDPEAGVVSSDMQRGAWISDPVVGVGKLPDATNGYVADVAARLHATSDTKKTYFDGVRIVRRENTSTEDPVDLVRHIGRLFDHAQAGREKSDWGITVLTGDPIGITEVGTWWHEDGQSMNDAIEAVCGRGLDVYDLPGPGRRVMVEARRGSVREDVAIRSSDVLGMVRWRVDPGQQRTAVRAVSAAGSIWGGADEGAVLYDQAGSPAQVIDVILSGPVGMTPTQLKAWCLDQLIGLSRLQGSMTVLLRWDHGVRLGVGDTVQVAVADGSAAHIDYMRVTEWVPERDRRFVAVSLGTDPDIGGL